MTNFEMYIEYIKSQLDSLDVGVPVKASYDTGYGLHLTSEHLGDETSSFDVRCYSVLKIQPPKIDNYDEWYHAWIEGKKLVNSFVEVRSKN